MQADEIEVSISGGKNGCSIDLCEHICIDHSAAGSLHLENTTMPQASLADIEIHDKSQQAPLNAAARMTRTVICKGC